MPICAATATGAIAVMARHSGRGKAREIAEYARPREPVGAVILGTGVPGGDTNHSSGMLAPILPKLKRRWTTQT